MGGLGARCGRPCPPRLCVPPHLGAGLCCPIDGHFGHPSEVGHAHLLGGAQHVRAEALIRHLQRSKARARGAPPWPLQPPPPMGLQRGFPAHHNLSPVVPAQEKSPNPCDTSQPGLEATRLHFKGGRRSSCSETVPKQQLWPLALHPAAAEDHQEIGSCS